MELQLEQYFYVHDGIGYGIVKNTNPITASIFEKRFTVEKEFANDSSMGHVSELCQSIGTPDRGKIEPFLFSAPIDNKLYMISGQQGEPDRSNRTTLFFHALVASLEQAQSAGIDAFVLQENGFFQSSLPIEIKPLIVSTEKLKKSPSNCASLNVKNINWDCQQPLVLVSNRPEPKLIRALLDTKKNVIFWSTYTYTTIPKAYLYVLSDMAVKPEDIQIITVANGVPNVSTVTKHKTNTSGTPTTNNNKSNISLKTILGWILFIVFLVFLIYQIYIAIEDALSGNESWLNFIFGL